MKRKLVAAMVMMMLALGITACGQNAESSNDTTKESTIEAPKEDKKETEEKEEPTAEPVEEKKDELPNWKGVYDDVGRSVVGHGSFGIKIAYPSLIPASSGCAYQMDPALVLVCSPGKDENGEAVVVEKVEDTLGASKRMITMYLQMYRGYDHTDFEFVVENQELLTINDLEACKYEGKHTYVVDGTTYEIPFAAYSFYTGQKEKYSYFTAIVMDDSLNMPSMEPLPEGTIQAYAKKMVESVEVR